MYKAMLKEASPLRAGVSSQVNRLSCREFVDRRKFSLNLLIEHALVVVIVGQRRVDLCQREVRELKMHLLGAAPVGALVENQFDDFHVGVVDPGGAITVESDMSCFGETHESLPSSDRAAPKPPLIINDSAIVCVGRWIEFAGRHRGALTIEPKDSLRAAESTQSNFFRLAGEVSDDSVEERPRRQDRDGFFFPFKLKKRTR